MAALDDTTRQRLLRLARTAIESALSRRAEEPDRVPWPTLERQGIFVTLRKLGRLRGCIGTFEAQDELPATVRSMALAAANDPRFVQMPVTLSEMRDLDIEISILSPLERVDGAASVEVGVHGIYVKRGLFSGCFLPGVATDNGWDTETFLTECCRQKAGLDPLAWQSRDTEVFVFTVEKLSEKGS
jgi:AmmeMemoRadiSam system protein A